MFEGALYNVGEINEMKALSLIQLHVFCKGCKLCNDFLNIFVLS